MNSIAGLPKLKKKKKIGSYFYILNTVKIRKKVSNLYPRVWDV